MPMPHTDSDDRGSSATGADPRTTSGPTATAHDPSRLVGRVVEATIDGWRRSFQILAVGAAGVQLLDRRSRRSVLVPPEQIAASRLTHATD